MQDFNQRTITDDYLIFLSLVLQLSEWAGRGFDYIT